MRAAVFHGPRDVRVEEADRRRLISHEFPLERAKEAYETGLSAEESVKVLIKPWAEEKL
ncbi:MAG TPA: hypothetical protein VM013_07080 [Dehalococcoidia bacterium]|nr:hypothetical protein [Dehalococcoidia bacterium]